jgi:hypothetical protein
MTLFAYLGFLETRLSLGSSFFPIPLVLRYRVTSESRFYQTWFLTFRVIIYFVGGCLTMWLKGLDQDVTDEVNVGDDVFQLDEWVDPYRNALSPDLKENSKFCIAEKLLLMLRS